MSSKEQYSHTSTTLDLNVGLLLRRHRLSVSTRAASAQQRGTPQDTVPVREASLKLEDYLPAKVVQGLRDAGFTRDLYPWQVCHLCLRILMPTSISSSSAGFCCFSICQPGRQKCKES